eukprot:7288714-Lingulodinium_polyedra.AAC.1
MPGPGAPLGGSEDDREVVAEDHKTGSDRAPSAQKVPDSQDQHTGLKLQDVVPRGNPRGMGHFPE